MLIRVLAFICAILMLVSVIAACVLGFMGSKYFLPMLFVCVLVSVLMWAISLITKLLRNKGQEMAQQVHDDKTDSKTMEK